MQFQVSRYAILGTLFILLFLAGCQTPPYEIVEENGGGAFRIEGLQVVAKDRRWAEPGISISGKIRGKFKPEAQPVILMRVSDTDEKVLYTHLNLGALTEKYGADLKIGKNDARFEGAVEWNDHSDIELEMGDSLPTADTTQLLLPVIPQAFPLIFQEAPFLAGPMDFQFFVPWRAIEGLAGTQLLDFSFLVLPDSLPPTETRKTIFEQKNRFTASQNGYLRVRMPLEKPSISAYQVLVSQVVLDTTQFDPSEMDFTLALGSNPHAGYPDIFWSVTVGNWLAWSSPRYKNSVIGHWETPSSPIFLYEGESVGICIFDFDDTTRDDEIGCWKGTIADLVATPDLPRELQFTNVAQLTVFAEPLKDAANLPF